ncbi:MAG: nucleotidyltransferase domain-containing protein [Anaerolineae bacterium]|nr:nucleotidyltransferase domain-containing protein [Anaerolineae bacterium]
MLVAYLFGSQAQGTPGPMSDYDLGLLVRSPTPQLRYRLIYELACILNTDRIDLVFIDQIPIELAYTIIAQGQRIYERDLGTRIEVESRILSQYADYVPVLCAQRDAILKGGRREAGIQRYREALGRTERTLAALAAIAKQDTG